MADICLSRLSKNLWCDKIAKANVRLQNAGYPLISSLKNAILVSYNTSRSISPAAPLYKDPQAILNPASQQAPEASGLLARHYAPPYRP